MVQNYTRLQELILNRRKQTATEWNNLIRSVLDEVDSEIRQATTLPGKDAPLTFEEYQEWTRTLGEIKGWNIAGGWPQSLGNRQIVKPQASE